MVDFAFPPYTYDDDLIRAARRDGQARVRVYRLRDTVVVLGSGSRPDVELHLDACHADRVPILRRRGGGCAVVLDPGNVIVSVVVTGLPFGHHRRHFDMLTSWLIAGLERIGVSGVRQAGICDLILGDRKVGGACLHRSREPTYRRGRSHHGFMGSLAAVAPDTACQWSGDTARVVSSMGAITSGDMEHVATRLRRELQPPSPEELSEVRADRFPSEAACVRFEL